MIKKLALAAAIAFGGMYTIDSIAVTPICAQEQKLLKEALSEEIKRLEQLNKTPKEYARLIDLYDYRISWPDETTRSKMQDVINEGRYKNAIIIEKTIDPKTRKNVESIDDYLKAISYRIADSKEERKNQKQKARELFEEVSKSKLEDRIKSNAYLRRLACIAPKDLTERHFERALWLDRTNLQAYAKQIENIQLREVNLWRVNHKNINQLLSEKMLYRLMKDTERTFETAIRKAKQNTLDNQIFKEQLYEKYTNILCEAARESIRNKRKYAEMADEVYSAWIEFNPTYENLVSSSRNLSSLRRTNQITEKAVDYLTRAQKIKDTGEVNFEIGTWLYFAADKDTQKLQESKNYFQKALKKPDLRDFFKQSAQRWIERIDKKLD